jgi:hypothetical protein
MCSEDDGFMEGNFMVKASLLKSLRLKPCFDILVACVAYFSY